MNASKSYKIVIAETAPVIVAGLRETLKSIKEFYPVVIEVDTQDSLFQTINDNFIDLLIINPTFGGILNPGEIRKSGLNNDIKIFAIEISKLNRATIALYDDHIHVTDDLHDIRNKVTHSIGLTHEDNEDKENLSSREKEIISHVVKGHTNQEIADLLFISVHTVMTHRRNIAKKLQIHSATGLTIYAIVNKIVDLSEIKDAL